MISYGEFIIKSKVFRMDYKVSTYLTQSPAHFIRSQ